ncbi:13420_t:CDS:2 [Ambispora gerdemannii]|uniref:13420_t:CDS:1 n=1 Tax=Ambispora gerdemannii TaxID=144530 RepID=A0A9N9GI62_9GLOM|nr:13420_t:CDS:2 [Ambispora gerdemannii]
MIVEFNLPPKVHLWCNVEEKDNDYNKKDRVNSDLEEIGSSNPINCAHVDCSLEAKLDYNDQAKRYSYCSSDCFWLEAKKLNSVKMTQVQETDPDYSTVRSKFLFGLPNAKIIAIIRLQMPKDITLRYQNYSLQVALENGVPTKNVIHSMFHGTPAACFPLDLVILNRVCNRFCGMCGIAKEGNKSICSKRRGRMWFASSSRVSLGYCGRNNTKAMFLVDVVSPKCDRILIVNKDKATLPRFLIIFEHDQYNHQPIRNCQLKATITKKTKQLAQISPNTNQQQRQELQAVNAEFTSRDKKFTAEVQRILTLLNTSIGSKDGVSTSCDLWQPISELRQSCGSQSENCDIVVAKAEPRDNDSSSSDQQSDANQSEASSGLWQKEDVLLMICVILLWLIFLAWGGKLSRDIIKNYYRRINDLKGSNLDKTGAWIDSKTNVVSDNSE